MVESQNVGEIVVSSESEVRYGTPMSPDDDPVGKGPDTIPTMSSTWVKSIRYAPRPECIVVLDDYHRIREIEAVSMGDVTVTAISRSASPRGSATSGGAAPSVKGRPPAEYSSHPW